MTRRAILVPILVAMLLGAIGWASAPLTAHAGGPTSVLLTNPEDGRARALYITNPDYSRLEAAVGDEAGGNSAPGGVRTGEEEVRLTWLIHDMQIWRIDRVYLTDQDGIWVETIVETTGHGDVFGRPSRWHRAHDEQALTSLLASTGLVGADSAPVDPSNPNDTSEVTNASAPPTRTVVPIVAAALGGLVIGAAGSLLLRRRPAVDQPRVTLSG